MQDLLPLITIVIVNYDTPDLTRECVDSLLNLDHEGFRYSVLVVDNGSQQEFKLPKTVLNNKDYEAEKIEIIRTEANIGFTGGNNLGMSHAVKYHNPDYFLLLNSDTTTKPDFLQKLFLCIQGEKRGIATCKIYFEEGFEFHKPAYSKKNLGNVLWFAGGTIDWPNLTAFHRGVDEVDRSQFDSSSETDFATGCCMLIKREVIEKVGILDKKYFLYLEDVDFSYRAIKKGYSIVFCPQAVVYHKNAGSTQGSGSPTQVYYQTRNRLLFFIQHARWRYKLTALKFLFKLLLDQDTVKRKAALDFVMQRFGKQPVI